MSDHLPPGSEMHINQMPEECLRLLFNQLPIQTQFEAGNVCQLWRTVRDGLFLTKKSLVVVISHHRHTEDCLIIAELKRERTAFLVAMFPNLIQLTIFISNGALFEASSSVAHLLVQYRHQLVTLKLNSEGSLNRFSPFKCLAAVLFSVINCMSKLKQLSLGFVNSSGALYLPPLDLPILRQLDKLDLNCSITEGSTLLKLWAPHLEARSTPMEISLTGFLYKVPFDCITPKVGSMFTQFPQLRCNLQQFRHLSTRFTNLIQLSLTDNATSNPHYASDVPALMQALVNLKQLNTLSIEAQYVAPLNAQPGDDAHLSQLPTVKKWHLNLRPSGEPHSHAHLSPWTSNLSQLFPALEDLSIIIDSVARCADCGLINPSLTYYMGSPVFLAYHKLGDASIPAKDCLRRQLGLIKQQQCPNLNKARISYSRSPVSCTLDDLAD